MHRFLFALDPEAAAGGVDARVLHGIDRVLRPINLPNKHSVS